MASTFVLSLNFEIETDADEKSMKDLADLALWRLARRGDFFPDEFGPSDRLQSYWATVSEKQITEA